MKSSGSLSRRALLKAGISTAAIAPILAATPSLGQLFSTGNDSDTMIPITIGGRLLD